MSDTTIQLELDRQELDMFSAHIFVYIACYPYPREGPSVEAIKEIGSQIFALDVQRGERVPLSLAAQQVRELRRMFRCLVQGYTENPPSPNRTRALRDLTVCWALLERAMRGALEKHDKESRV